MTTELHYTHKKTASIPPIIWLVICVGIGLGIRVWASVTQPLFGDEAFSLYEIRFWQFPYDPSYPPGYPLFLKLWTGASDELLWARVPSVIAGTLSILVFWKILIRYFSPRTAAIGTLLLSLSALHIHYSWIARPNSITALIELLSLSQLFGIADQVKKKTLPTTRTLLLYFVTNAVGAFFSHGYSIFLAGSFATLAIWFLRYFTKKTLLDSFRSGIILLSLHLVLPIMQYFFIHGRVGPLVESAEWIPTFSVYSITSAFLALFNGAKTLTSEMWTAASITVYFTLMVLIILGRLFVSFLEKHHQFAALLFVVGIGSTLVGVGILDIVLGMNTLQPRLLLFLHMLYIMGLAVTLPELASAWRHRLRRYTYETLFLLVLLAFNVRTLIKLNLMPFYNTQENIRVVTALKNAPDTTLLVFPRYQTLTVKYLWGLDDPYPRALVANDRIHALPQDASATQIAALVPSEKPLTILLWPYDAILPSAPRHFVERVSPRCKKNTYSNLAILNCPPDTHTDVVYEEIR